VPLRIGPLELIIVMVIVLVIFGVGKLPEIGSAMGRSIRDFRKAQLDEEHPDVAPSGRETGGRGGHS